MQPVKDSFYMTLRDRLLAAQPEATAPALRVCENERCAWLAEPDTIYLRWTGELKLPPDAQAAGWHAIQCEIGYRTAGSELASGEDRGRQLAGLDQQLLAISAPRVAALFDYTQTPPCALDGTILWTSPVLTDAQQKINSIQRTANFSVLWREQEVLA